MVDKRTILWYNMLRQAGKDMIVRTLAVVYCKPHRNLKQVLRRIKSEAFFCGILREVCNIVRLYFPVCIMNVSDDKEKSIYRLCRCDFFGSLYFFTFCKASGLFRQNGENPLFDLGFRRFYGKNAYSMRYEFVIKNKI